MTWRQSADSGRWLALTPRTRRRPGGSGSERGVEHEIGADVDLDEAELGRYDPLDGKPWDGPARRDEDTGLSGGDAVLRGDDSVLSDDELEATPAGFRPGQAAGGDRAACRTERGAGLA